MLVDGILLIDEGWFELIYASYLPLDNVQVCYKVIPAN